MADFVAVLRRTLDGLGETTPEIRQKVYAKARTMVEAKLAAITPPPPAPAAARQKKQLEDAIRAVEAEYASKEEEDLLDPIEELESAIASLSVVQPGPSVSVGPETSLVEAPEALVPEEEADGEHQPAGPALQERQTAGEVERRRKGPLGLLVALGVLVLIAAAGYVTWLNKDQIVALWDAGGSSDTASPEEAPTRDLAQEDGVPGGEPAPEPDQPASRSANAAAPEETRVEKFTQRLQPDGTEIDMGSANEAPVIGEGTSVATAAPPQQGPGPHAAETRPLVAVGQKAIFYEERTNVAQGSATDGSIVWSLVQESPGGELPPEPAIRAEATIPGKDLQLRMTIRRNGDPSLPASHIVELIFLTPDDFEGGGIDNVLRIALKDSEEAAGNPLIGIPAKIADGFFLFALSDGSAEAEANTTMMRRQGWLDIPIVYRSGRRALITMEKGIPGDNVFDEALQAWQSSGSG